MKIERTRKPGGKDRSGGRDWPDRRGNIRAGERDGCRRRGPETLACEAGETRGQQRSDR